MREIDPTIVAGPSTWKEVTRCVGGDWLAGAAAAPRRIRR